MLTNLLRACQQWQDTEETELPIAEAVAALWQDHGAYSWWRGSAWIASPRGGDVLRVKGRSCEVRLSGVTYRDVELCPRLLSLPAGVQLVVCRAFLSAVWGTPYQPMPCRRALLAIFYVRLLIVPPSCRIRSARRVLHFDERFLVGRPTSPYSKMVPYPTALALSLDERLSFLFTNLRIHVTSAVQELNEHLLLVDEVGHVRNVA